MTSTNSGSRGACALRSAFVAGLLMIGFAADAKGGDTEVAGEVLVKLTRTDAIGALLIRYGLTLEGQFGARPIYRLKVVDPTADVHDTIAALGRNVNVLIAEPNFVHQSPEARRNNSWAIGVATDYTAQWAPEALRLTEAHKLSTGGGVRVAVLDTGVDFTHPTLAARLLPGFDFVDFDLDPSEVGSQATNIAFGHGTHVAGLVALAAPAAKIMPLRVLDADGAGNAWVLAEAMLYAIDPDGNPATDDGAHVINLSLGSLSRTKILDTIGKLATCAIPAAVLTPSDDLADPGYNADRDRCSISRGAVVVAAAGNDATKSEPQYPAAEGVYGLMAVGASNSNKQLADFSNFGSWVHVAAPGEGIASALPAGAVSAPPCKRAVGCFGTWSGTSMAAPLAAGTAALVRAGNPGLTPREITRRIIDTSSNLCGTPLRQVDAAAAVSNVVPADTSCR